MNHPLIDIFDYDAEIEKLPMEWMVDMAEVFREFDEDSDGRIPSDYAKHVFSIFRLPSKGVFVDGENVSMREFLYEAGIMRDELFSQPETRYQYYFKMIAGLKQSEITAQDIQRFMKVNGDDIKLKFCDDFIDEFDRKRIAKDSINMEQFVKFCTEKKIPV
jgi:Ca2+-binding EF-hand superfamily protein